MVPLRAALALAARREGLMVGLVPPQVRRFSATESNSPEEQKELTFQKVQKLMGDKRSNFEGLTKQNK